MATRLIRLWVALIFLSAQTGWAQVITPLEAPSFKGSEFFVGKQYGKPLITVNLVNGVARPGVYHVPVGTNLAQLLAYAGGSDKTSDISLINIQRNVTQQAKVVQVDLASVIKSTRAIPSVRDKDIIQIDPKRTPTDDLLWLRLIGTIFSIGVSFALIYDIDQRNN